MSHAIIEDYLREVERHLAPGSDKASILQELRAHLGDKAADIRAQDPDVSPWDAERRAINSFGAPREVAAGYGALAQEPRRAEVALALGRGLARGTGKVVKGIAIAIAFLLVFGAAVAYVAWHEAKPVLESQMPRDVYAHHDRCATPCNQTASERVFTVYNGTRELHFAVQTLIEAPQGSVRVVLRDPEGNVRYERTLVAESLDQSFSERTSLPVLLGDWRVTTELAGFSGWLHLDVDGVGVPPGTL